LQGYDVAERVIVNALHGVLEAIVVPQAQTGYDGEIAALGLAARVEDRTHAGRIDGARLLGEDVLTRVHRGPHVHRPKVRRRAQQYDIDTAVDDLPIRVEADELAFTGHIDFAGDFGVLPQHGQSGLGTIAK